MNMVWKRNITITEEIKWMKLKVLLLIVYYTLFSFLCIHSVYVASCAFSDTVPWRQMYWRPFIIKSIKWFPGFRIVQSFNSPITSIYHSVWCCWYVSHPHDFASQRNYITIRTTGETYIQRLLNIFRLHRLTQ